MSTVTGPSSLQDLIDFLDGLSERASIEALNEHLSALQLTRSDLARFISFGCNCYKRNPVKQGRWYELLCICWKSGQSSLIHNHAGSTCGLKIIDGNAIELRFELDEASRAVPTSAVEFREGEVCCTQDADVHQVCNNDPQRELITLHIYSPPLNNMQTWACEFPEEAEKILENSFSQTHSR